MVDYESRVWYEPSGSKAVGWGPRYPFYRGSDRLFFLAAHRPGEVALLASVEQLNGVAEVPESELAVELTRRFSQIEAQVWVSRLTAAGLTAHVLTSLEENMEDPIQGSEALS